MSKPAAQKIETVPIDAVHQDPANVRRHPDRNLDAIKASLARFGQVTPIVVDGDGIIRKGNGTHAAAKLLGWDFIKVVRSELRGVEATAYAIADNKTALTAEWDDTALAETLRALQAEPDFPIEATGFTDDEIDALVGMSGDEVLDPEGEWEGMPEFSHDDLTAKRSIQVHFLTDDAVRDFAERIGQPVTDKTKFVWHPQQEVRRYGSAE